MSAVATTSGCPRPVRAAFPGRRLRSAHRPARSTTTIPRRRSTTQLCPTVTRRQCPTAATIRTVRTANKVSFLYFFLEIIFALSSSSRNWLMQFIYFRSSDAPNKSLTDLTILGKSHYRASKPLPGDELLSDVNGERAMNVRIYARVS